MKILDLSRNRLSKINRNTFAGLHLLERLHLENNQFTYFDHGALDCRNLTYLDLGGNRLQTLDAWIFARLPELRSLILHFNIKENIEII